MRGHVPVAEIEELRTHLLPVPRALAADGEPFNPRHCMAIYHAPVERGPTLEFPGILIGQSAIAPFGAGCTLLGGVPGKPPGGSIVLGTWDVLARAYPAIFEPLAARRPEIGGGYVLRIDRFALIAGVEHAGCLHGAQTLIQLLAAAGEYRTPGVTILDEPDLPLRSTYYDLTRHAPKPEHLMRVAGFCSSFKGNRLHLGLDAAEPLSDQVRPGSLVRAITRDFVQVAAEYGLSVIPWGAFLARVASGQADPGETMLSVLALADTLGAPVVGLGGLPAGVNDESARAFLRSLLQRLQPQRWAYLDAGTLLRLYPDPSTAPRGLAAWVEAGPHAARQIERLRAAKMPVSFHRTTGGAAFLPRPPEAIWSELDEGIGLAATRGLDEICVSGGGLHGGKVWENTLIHTLSGIAHGWRAEAEARDCAQRFVRLAYDGPSERIVAHLARMAALAPALELGSAPLARATFDLAGDGETWTALAAHDWSLLHGRIDAEEAGLRITLQNVPRNADTVQQLDIPLQLLRWLAIAVESLREAAMAYAHAEDDRAALYDAANALFGLADAAPPAIQRLRAMAEHTGACQSETQRLEATRARLQEVAGRLQLLAADEEGIPSWAELDLPPIPAVAPPAASAASAASAGPGAPDAPAADTEPPR